MPKLTVQPQNLTFDIPTDENVMDFLRTKELYVRSSCGGNGSCSDCLIKITKGEDNVNSPSFEELQLIGNVFHITKERLSCQTKLTGDVEVDISSHDLKTHQEQSRKKMSHRTRAGIKVRKKAEVEQVMKDRQEMIEAKREERDAKAGQKGGLSRPKPFIIREDEEES